MRIKLGPSLEELTKNALSYEVPKTLEYTKLQEEADKRIHLDKIMDGKAYLAAKDYIAKN